MANRCKFLYILLSEVYNITQWAATSSNPTDAS